MMSRLLNEAELFFTDTLRRLNLISSTGRSYSKLKGSGTDDHRRALNKITTQEYEVSSLPLVVLWVDVPFLHRCFLFGGLAFVWKQHEGDIAVYAIFTVRRQTSVDRRKKNPHQWYTQEY